MYFIVIWYECSLDGPLLDSVSNYNLAKNTAVVGGGYFHYRTYSENLKNLLLHDGYMDFIIS